jgi:ankyrin repeat protein
VVATLLALDLAGADVDARCEGGHRETALHWAASCDDVAALDALLDAGAAIEAAGAVIAGGTALDDAVAFAQWGTARRLVERGAQMAVWHAAALGHVDLLGDYFAAGEPAAKHPWGASRPSPALHIAFWCACHGGQRGSAEWLLARGADVSWVAPWDGLTPLDTARRNGHAHLVAWLEGIGARSAQG